MASRTAPRFVPEESVLIPTNEVSNDKWPMYVLNDAIVYRPDGKTIAHALLINQDGPFTIRGRLEILDDDKEVQFLIDPTVRTIDIEIKDSKFYSIGYDPEAALWLSGKGGWFEINPHPLYAKIHQDICQISQLDYIMADIYLEEDGRLRDTRMDPSLADIKEVLLRYAMALGDGITYDETVDKIVRLGPAYVSHMECSDADGTPWRQTSIYSWLVRELKVGRQTQATSNQRNTNSTKNKERSRRSSSRGTSQPPLSAYVASAAASSANATSGAAAAAATVPVPAASQQSSRPLSQILAFRGSPATIHETAPTPLTEQGQVPEENLPDPYGTGPVLPEEEEAVFQLFLRIVLAIGETQGPPATVTPGKVHATLNKNYKLSKYNTGKELSSYFSKRLLESLGEAWDGSPYKHYLASDERLEWVLPSSSALRGVPGQLVRRGVAPPRINSLASRASSQTIPYTSTPPPARPLQTTPQTGGKSAGLRPPVAAKKRPHGGAFGGEADYDSDDIPDYPRGAASTAAATAASQQVPRPVGRPRKIPKTDTLVPEAEPIEDDAGVDDSSDDSSDTNDNSDDDIDDDDNESETVVAVHSVPLNVSTRPTGPNSTWECPHPKCRFFVRNATGSDGADDKAEDAQTVIRDHLRKHEQKTLSRVDLAISEGSRKHVSVEALADAKADQNQQDGAPRPSSSAVGTSSSNLRRFLF